jgi:hypothetical protein
VGGAESRIGSILTVGVLREASRCLTAQGLIYTLLRSPTEKRGYEDSVFEPGPWSSTGSNIEVPTEGLTLP